MESGWITASKTPFLGEPPKRKRKAMKEEAEDPLFDLKEEGEDASSPPPSPEAPPPPPPPKKRPLSERLTERMQGLLSKSTRERIQKEPIVEHEISYEMDSHNSDEAGWLREFDKKAKLALAAFGERAQEDCLVMRWCTSHANATKSLVYFHAIYEDRYSFKETTTPSIFQSNGRHLSASLLLDHLPPELVHLSRRAQDACLSWTNHTPSMPNAGPIEEWAPRFLATEGAAMVEQMARDTHGMVSRVILFYLDSDDVPPGAGPSEGPDSSSLPPEEENNGAKKKKKKKAPPVKAGVAIHVGFRHRRSVQRDLEHERQLKEEEAKKTTA